MYTRMALRVKPYFLPTLWMTMAGLALLTAGDRSRLGEESREDGLDDSEWGDIGLANGEAPWWSEDGQKTDRGGQFLARPGSTLRYFKYLLVCFIHQCFIIIKQLYVVKKISTSESQEQSQHSAASHADLQGSSVTAWWRRPT